MEQSSSVLALKREEEAHLVALYKCMLKDEPILLSLLMSR